MCVSSTGMLPLIMLSESISRCILVLSPSVAGSVPDMAFPRSNMRNRF